MAPNAKISFSQLALTYSNKHPFLLTQSSPSPLAGTPSLRGDSNVLLECCDLYSTYGPVQSSQLTTQEGGATLPVRYNCQLLLQ